MPPYWSNDLGTAEIGFVIVYSTNNFVKDYLRIFTEFFGKDTFEVKRMKFLKHSLLFAAGGFGYVAAELLWRGWSHGTMFLAGGSCFLLIGKLERVSPRLPIVPRCLVGSAIITSVELLSGMLFNRSYRIWDYRETPLNFCGQICLPYTLLWIPMSFAALLLYDFLDRRLDRLFARR